MEQFLLVNTARSRATRTKRATNPMHKGLVQKLEGGVRVLRGRPTVIGIEALKAILPDVLKRQGVGILEVRSMDGRRVHFKEDGKFEVDPLPKPPPVPFSEPDMGFRTDEMGKEKYEYSEAGAGGVDFDSEFELPEPAVTAKTKLVESDDDDLEELELPPAVGSSDTLPATAPGDEEVDSDEDAEDESEEDAEDETEAKAAPGAKPKAKSRTRKNRRRS